MNIAIKVDLQKAKQKLSNESMTRGKIAVASKILLDNEQYIPLRGGELRASGRIVGQGDAVVYGTVYARAQFYGQTALSPLGDIPLQVQENDGIKLLLVNMLKNGLELL